MLPQRVRRAFQPERPDPKSKRVRLENLTYVLVLFCCGGADWLHFRGTDGTGTSAEKDLPKAFRESKDVAWKAPLPGPGPAGPIVVGGRVVVTAASGPRQERLHVLAFDAAAGKLRWERQLWATGHVIFNPFGGIAGSTPASDGRLIFALFSSNDLACFDLDGNVKWLRGLAFESPTTRSDVGMASSPLVVGDTVVVQLENPGASFAMGIDTATGQTRWRLERPSESTWTSPALLRGKTPAEDVVLLQSRSQLSAHQPQTGKEVWRWEAGCSTMSSPTAAAGCVFTVAGGGITCLRPAADDGRPQVVWEDRRLRCDNVSPVVGDGRVYAIKSPGILVCGDAATGNLLWQLRLKGPIWATPVVADGHAYVVSHEGLVQIVRLGAEGTLVGTGQIDPAILATPAVAGGAIYFRSNSHLWKVAEKRPATKSSNPP